MLVTVTRKKIKMTWCYCMGTKSSYDYRHKYTRCSWK